MHTYIPVDGILPGATPWMIPNELDLALGFSSVKWVAILDPEYRIGGGVLNRASGNLITPPTPWDGDNDGLLPNGSPAFRISSTAQRRLVSDVAINPDAWTALFVLNITSTDVTGARDLIAPEVVTGPGIALRISLRTAGQLSIYPTAATTPRLTVSAENIPSEETFLLMCTFSVTSGLKVFVNGEQVAAAPDDVAPLNDQFGAGQWSFYRYNSGTGDLLAGLTGLMWVDLSLPENAGYYRSIVPAFLASGGI